jgi:S-DNA-T family DNA segregation ATPase FtsK/SpoIIIE
MANKLKNSAGKKVKADPKKADSKAFKKEKEESVDWKKLARDERTWKIAGALFLLIAVFLLVAFISYFFTWKEDQAKVFRGGSSLLVDNDIKVSNLLGRLGALVSHFFIYKGFGIASLLIVTFFFVVGTNLLFNRKVFSIWRNLKYVTIGLLVLSTSLAFVLSASDFPFGGGTGMMISRWLTGIFGTIGTAALLMVVAFAYFIWQFNPAFRVPGQTKELMPSKEGAAQDQTEEAPTAAAGKTINEMYAAGEGNSLKGNTRMIDLAVNDAANIHDLKMTEKIDDLIEKETVSDILHTHEEVAPGTTEQPKKDSEIRGWKKGPGNLSVNDLELEINTAPDEPQDEIIVSKRVEDLPPYEPTLDLKKL